MRLENPVAVLVVNLAIRGVDSRPGLVTTRLARVAEAARERKSFMLM
jgi:hypothetical protein